MHSIITSYNFHFNIIFHHQHHHHHHHKHTDTHHFNSYFQVNNSSYVTCLSILFSTGCVLAEADIIGMVSVCPMANVVAAVAQQQRHRGWLQKGTTQPACELALLSERQYSFLKENP